MNKLERLQYILKNHTIETIYIKGETRFDGSMRFDYPLYKATNINNVVFISKDDDNYITIKESTLYDSFYQNKTLIIELN